MQNQQLLEKDPNKRLGKKGADSIKKHPFFTDIDWKKLSAKQIEPPHKPEVVIDLLLFSISKRKQEKKKKKKEIWT